MNNDQLNINQEQQQDVIGGNIQNGVPQQQDDPALVINQHYLPRGDLTISSNISFVDSSVTPITIPLVQMPLIFEQIFDSTEMNFTTTDDLIFSQNRYKPAPHMQIPNIARYLGYVITGTDMDTKFLESMMICCGCYLDGTMEILPSGTFRYLNQRRDGTNRRYSPLCMAVYYSISSAYYQIRPKNLEIVKQIQSLMQDIYENSNYTSVLTRVRPMVIAGQEYIVNKSTLRRWATTIPWHALMYNSQSPLSFQQFIDLYFKVFSINQGKILRYDISHPNEQTTQTIMPNSHLFVKLTPENMISSEVHITTDIPQRFINLIRYLALVENEEITWSEDDEDETEEEVETDQMSEGAVSQDAESMDDWSIAF
jgi:hypothetical protein